MAATLGSKGQLITLPSFNNGGFPPQTNRHEHGKLHHALWLHGTRRRRHKSRRDATLQSVTVKRERARNARR